jgi:hypothetical protein
MARQQEEKLAAVTTGSAGSSGIPRAMFDGLYVLSLETGLIASIIGATRERYRRLGLSTGRPGPHDFTVRIGCSSARMNRAATRYAHRIPHPTFVTTRVHPSAWGRTMVVKHDFRKNEREILGDEGRKEAIGLKALMK